MSCTGIKLKFNSRLKLLEYKFANFYSDNIIYYYIILCANVFGITSQELMVDSYIISFLRTSYLEILKG